MKIKYSFMPKVMNMFDFHDNQRIAFTYWTTGWLNQTSAWTIGLIEV